VIGEAVVPVAGLGTRLLPATKAQPKEMLPVGTKPVVQHVVEELAAAGVTRVIFVTGRGKGAIEDHFDPDPALVELLRRAGKEELLARLDFERLGITFAYVRQPRPLGLGDAVRCAGPVLGSRPFLLALGDSILTGAGAPPLAARLAAAVERGASCAVAVEPVATESVGSYGIAVPRGEAGAESFELAGLVEKPDPATAPSTLAVAGRYALGPRILAALEDVDPGHGGEVQLTDAIAALIEAGERVVAVPLVSGERRLDTGTPAAYAAAFVELALADPQLAPALQARLEELGR
jgi:UTP--glucose-1-phosphate uridylyltransferase